MFSLTSSESCFLDEADSHIQANLEDEVVQEALRSGVDLREYSSQVETELKDVEKLAIDDYIRQSENIAQLHNQIVHCDHILERMENMLLSFQTDLGSISSEILSLQQQSVQMNLKLRNRQSVRGELSQFVNDMVIPESMITAILEAPVTEQEFLDNLLNLEQKITFLKEQSFRDARSCLDVRDVVEKLKIKAISKIREFLLEKITLFKKPMANYHIPQNTMVKFKFYYKFLMANNRDVAKEIRSEYVDTMSKVLFSYFKSYSGRLLKLQYDQVASREDLMGYPDDSMNRTTAGASFLKALGSVTGASGKSKASVFSMGQRAEILKAVEAPIMVPHAQRGTDTKFPFEVLFRSEQYGFMENACREYAFIVEFFMVTGNETMDLFQQIIGKTVSILIKNVDSNFQESYDSISLFLCIHLVQKFRALCLKKGVPALEKYWESILNLIWPRLNTVMQMNIQSIKDCDTSKMKMVDQRPHYITRRYAEFAGGLLSVLTANDPDGGDRSKVDELIRRLLADLQQEVEHFILKMTVEFPSKKEQLIFLINNYDLILTVISERCHGECRETDSFKDLMSTRSSEYVEQILQPHFGNLIRFIQRSEVCLQNGDEKALKEEYANVTVLLKNFNSGWKAALDRINREILGSFPNFKNGTTILQQTLMQFVQYYHRFHKVLSHPIFAAHPDKTQLINVHQLMVEVKKYKPNF